jgi:acid phosphatase family membrane protein YuiD
MNDHFAARYAYILVPFFSWAIAQFMKPFFYYLAERKWNLKLFWQSSGMPSSHSSTTAGLTTIIGLREGVTTSVFAAALTFTMIVMYDAKGVRKASGQHAAYLNTIMDDINAFFRKGMTHERFKTELGHSTNQVAVGALLGFLVGFVFEHFILS